MRQRFRWWCALALVGIPLLLVTPVTAQDEFEVWGGGEGLWTLDDNWTFGGDPSGAPSLANERGAQINNGTVIVDDDVDTAGLLLNGGTLDIQSGSLLSNGTDLQTGITDLNGTLQVAGGSSFTGPDVKVKSNGSVNLLAPTSGFETKGDLTLGGGLQLSITGAGTSSIKVGGSASVGGVISPVFDGVSPAFGDTFPFLSGAQSVSLANPVVELPANVVLDRGLEARVDFDDSSASLAIGNVPVVQVDRVAGTTKILNVVGGDITITGYTIGSKLGLLNDTGFTPTGADGFIAPNRLTTSLSEISIASDLTLAVGDELNLGQAYNGGATHPNDEDVSFQFSTPNGRVLNGLVEYTGPANDFVANVNPDTGEVSLYHLSAHVDPIDVTGYTIASASESLDAAAFTGIGEENWVNANPLAGRLSEVNLESSKLFNNGTVISLGNIFKTDGARDITVQYSTADSLFTATVEYGEVPGLGAVCNPNSQGDLDGNGTVDFLDFLALANNFGNAATDHTTGDIDCNGTVEFLDFLTLANNFGSEVGGAAAAVPEPSGLVLLGLAGLFGGLLRRRRESKQPAFVNEDTVMKYTWSAMKKNDVVRLAMMTGLALSVSLFSTTRTNAQSSVTKGIDTYLTSAAKDGADGFYGEETSFEWDGDDGGGFNQGLLYFEIPQDFLDAFAAGTNPQAILKLRNIDSGSSGIFHRMTVDWLQGLDGGNFVAFNSIPGGPGIVPGDNAEEVSNFNTGDLTNGIDYEFDVTVDVLAWAGGEPNFGWGILPGGGGGNGIASFEDMTNPSPSLELLGLFLTDGDFNGDGVTNTADFIIMTSNFYNEGTFAEGDFDFSGRIDLLDFIGFRRAFQAQPAGAASVPEPSSALLLVGCGGLLLLGRRRRHNLLPTLMK